MDLFNIIAVLLTLSATFGYLNHRYIKLPVTIGTMLISMVLSVLIVSLGHFGGIGSGIEGRWLGLVRSIEFDKTLLVGMLGFLLFAGALGINLDDLLPRRREVLLLATVGTALSTALIGAAAYGISTVAGPQYRSSPLPALWRAHLTLPTPSQCSASSGHRACPRAWKR